MSAEAKTSLLSNKAYDVAKDATQIWLPALAALYSAIAIVWGLPFHAEVVATIAAIVVFMGTVLKVSSTRYAKQEAVYDGELVVNMTDPESETMRLSIDEHWDELANRDNLRIKIINESTGL